MTAEKKKRIKIIVLCILAVLLVFVAICACVPFLRHRVLRVPIKTEALFPKPDAIIAYCNGEQYTFTEAQTEVLYNIFADAMNNIESCERNNASSITWHSYALRWEFRYYDYYRYIGEFSTQEPFSPDTFAFNKICMQSQNGLLLEFFSKIDQNQYATVNLQDYSPVNQFLNMVERFSIANLMDTSLWQVTDTEALVSNVWPAKPDSIYVYQNAASVELEGAELDDVYQRFMDSISRYGWGEQSAGSPGYSMSSVANSYICFEFRYKKRQMYMPDEIPDTPIFTPFEALYKEREYDSLLFVIENDQLSEANLTARIAYYGPHNMISPNMARQPSFITKTFVEYLSTFLKEV